MSQSLSITPIVSTNYTVHERGSNARVQEALRYARSTRHLSKIVLHALSKTINALETFFASTSALQNPGDSKLGQRSLYDKRVVFEQLEEFKALKMTLEDVVVRCEDHTRDVSVSSNRRHILKSRPAN
jgi:hypothetical protein